MFDSASFFSFFFSLGSLPFVFLQETAPLACSTSYASCAWKHCHPACRLPRRSLPCCLVFFKQEEEGEQFWPLRHWRCTEAPPGPPRRLQWPLPHVFIAKAAHRGVPQGAVAGELGPRLVACRPDPPR